jgi:hypothetical protein
MLKIGVRNPDFFLIFIAVEVGYMKVLKNILILAAMATLTSCLEPEGENFVEVTAPDLDLISLDLNEVEDDTLYIAGPVRYTYSVNGYPLELTDVEVHIDSHTIYAVTNYENFFDVYPQHVPIMSGTYTMTIKLTGRTANGSLADMAVGEFIEITRSYPVIIDIATPDPLPVTIDSSNGTLTLHWPKYTRRNFKSYRVVKRCATGSECVAEYITDPNITSWNDTQYTAGRVTYNIELYTQIDGATGMPLTYEWQPKFSTNVGADRRITLTWEKPLYYNNVKKIKAEFGPNVFEAPVDELVYTVPQPLLFGPMYRYKLTYEPSIVEQQVMIEHGYEVGTTYYYPVEKPTLYNRKENLYYSRMVLNGPGTTAFDTDFNIINSDREMFKAISENGEYFVTLKNGSFYTTHPTTFDLQLKHQIPIGTPLLNFAPGNNGLMSYETGFNFTVIDLETGSVVYNSTGGQENARLAPSGTWFINDARQVFRFNGTNFTLSGTLPAAFSVSKFVYLDNDRMASVQDTDLVIYNGNDLSVVATVNDIPALTGLQYDAVSNRILGTTEQFNNYLINPDTQEVFVVSYPGQYAGMTLLNGKVFLMRDFYVLTVDHTYFEL